MALAAGRGGAGKGGTGGGSKDGRDGEGGDGPGGLMQPAELRAALKRAERKPASCVIGLTKGRQAVILLDRLRNPRKLLGEAKMQAKAAGLDLDLASLRFGRVSASGKDVAYTVNKAMPPAAQQAMRAPMRAAGHPSFTVNADPAIEDEPDGPDETEDVGEAGGAGSDGLGGGAHALAVGSAAPSLVVPAAAAAAPDGAAPAAASPPRAPLAGMVPPDVARGVAAAVAADPSRRTALAGLLAQVRAGVDGGDPGAAERGIAALRQAVDGPAPALDEEGKTAEGRATGAGKPGAAPSVLASEPRPMQASATLADLARAWSTQQGQAGAAGPGGPGRRGGPKAPAPPASKGGDENLVTPVLSKQPWAPPAAPPAPPAPSGQLPPGLVPEVQGPSPLPGSRTLAREGLRAGGRGVGRFLLTKPNPYLMVAGIALLVAMELMPRADEDAGEATVTLRQQGAGGQPGREVAKLHMDQTGALRAEPGGRGAVLGQMDPSGRIALTPAGEAYLAEWAKGAQAPPAQSPTPAQGGFPGGMHDAMGNWTGPGTPDEGSPQPGAPAQPEQTPAEVPAPPAPGTPPQPAPPLVMPDAGFEYDPHDPDEAELVATMRGRSGQDIQNAINELRARKRGAGGSGAGTPPSGNGPVVPGQPPAAPPPARPGAAQPTPRDGVVGGKPAGEPETDPSAEPDKQEGLRLQAASEDAMAAAGFRVERSPVVRPDERLTQEEDDKLGPKGLDPLGRVGPRKKPDDRIGGNLADMVAPKTPKLEGVRDALSAKIKLRQAYRLVLNLGRTSVTREQVEALLRRKPVEGLQELFIIERNGAIFRAFPEPGQVAPAPQAR